MLRNAQHFIPQSVNHNRMKIYLLLTTFFLTACAERSLSSNSRIQLDKVSGVPSSVYLWDAETNEVWNDSIRIFSDRLVVYKDPKYGFGRVISFTYRFAELNENKLVLEALSMDPEGMFVLPEQYEWHRDTLEFQILEDDTSLLIGPDKEAYKHVNKTKK